MSFFRRRQASVQVQDSQAALVHQQQQQQVIREQQLRQQQQASARDRDAQQAAVREREMEQQRERIERERERQALQRETAQREREAVGNALGGSPSQQQHISSSREQASPPTNNATMQPPPQQLQSQSQQPQQQPPPPPREREREREPPSQPQQPSQSQSAGHKTSPTGRPAYPWSARRLTVQPVSTLIRQPGPPTQSPSPFPRYGHSLPPISTASGELFLFGGLVKEQIKNDLYSFSTRDLSVALIETKGEIPPPRVGHASALVSSVLIVWGGDTKTNDRDRQDDALYLLNLGTREWTRVSTTGRAPPGRYGHAVTMCGTRFFVFGGQVDGEFLNDLWAFDLSSLKTPDPNWDLYSPAPGSDLPARRTGHVCVTHNEKIYMFGGTDGQYHYNDTWCFDVPSRTWRELTCIGFIPVPREGHAAALVDDVMYVFGGRGVDGKDLSDLAAFKISNSRWYMFQNMGPSPSGRSGHAMAASGSRVFVLGGESFTTEKPDDPSIIHVLDSRHIKYPDSNRAPPANAPPPGTAGRRPSVGAGSAAAAAAREQQQQAAQQPIPVAAGLPVSSPPTQTSALANVNANLQKESARDRAMSPPARDRALSPSSTTSRAGAMSPQERVIQQQQAARSGSPSTGPASSTPPLTQRAISPTNKPAANGGVSFPLGAGAAALANGSATPTPTTTPALAPAPAPVPAPSPAPATTAPAPTPTASATSSSPQPNGSTRGKPPPRPKRGDDDLLYGAGLDKDRSEEGSVEPSGPLRDRAISPPVVSTPTLNPTRAISPPNGIVRTGRDSPSVVAQQMSRINGLAARSPSPSSGPPPADAFYSSGSGLKSPTINGHPSRLSGNVGADIVRAKEVEIEGLKRRETWMKAALARAAKAGFVWTDGDLQESRVGTWMHDDESSDHAHGDEEGHGRRGVANTVMKLKQEQAKLQAAFSSQAKSISDRLAESDRIRNAAVQEAAFYRAKLAAYENGTIGDVNRLERDRMNALETQVQALTSERSAVERKLEDANEAHLLQSRLREQAEERAAEAVRRAEIAEEAHEAVKREHSELREKHLTVESNLRDHTDRLLSVTSSTSQLESERNALRSQVNELLATRDQHQRALDQARSALDASGARAAEMDAQWQASKNRIVDLEEELNQMRGDLEARIQETESVAARLADVENAWAKSREEADEYRAGLTGSIGKLLDTQRELQADEDRASRGHAEKQRAMEQEMSSLRKMLKEAGQRVDAAQAGLAEHRDRARTAESGLLALRSQVSGLRSQLAVALADTGRLRKDLASREAELRDKSKAAAEGEVRLGMLRNYLSDNGLVIDEDELTSSQGSSGSSRLLQLQNQLRETKQLLEDTEIRCQDTLRDKADLESQLRLMSNEIDRLRVTVNKSPSSAEESNARAVAAERKLAESEAAHKDKLQQMENDYQTAVHYVRGTENMLRRMKDELAKQKTINTNLQNELDSSRGINGSEAGSRTRNANGRNTPMSDEDGYRAQLSEAQRNAQRLALENQDLHRRLDNLTMEVEELRDKLVDSQRMADARLQHAEELQSEVDRLDSALRLTRSGDSDAFMHQLEEENSVLKTENRMLSDKINLLLEDVEPGYRSQRESTLSARRDSRASSNNFESLQNEIEDWHRRFVPSSNSNRPISDYDEPSRRTPTERLR